MKDVDVGGRGNLRVHLEYNNGHTLWTYSALYYTDCPFSTVAVNTWSVVDVVDQLLFTAVMCSHHSFQSKELGPSLYYPPVIISTALLLDDIDTCQYNCCLYNC